MQNGETGLKWRAGRAVPARLESAGVWAMGLGSSLARKAAPLLAGLCISQAASVGFQLSYESKVADDIALAKSELAWLQKHGQQNKIYVGEAQPLLRKANDLAAWLLRQADKANDRDKGGKSGAEAAQGEDGGEASWYMARDKYLPGGFKAVGVFGALVDDACFMEAAKAQKPDFDGTEEMERYVVRHEASHCVLMSNPALLEKAKPRLLEGKQADVFMAMVKSAYYETGVSDWRTAYLGTLVNEAFADARALLLSAKKSPGLMQADALKIHAWRTVGFSGSSNPSIKLGFSDHATAPAAFIVAQLPEKEIAALSMEEIDNLAIGIAVDAAAWASALQTKSQDLYSKASGSGLELAKRLGARADYEKLSDQMASSAPPAVFGELAYEIGGEKRTVRTAQRQEHFRMDGFNGTLYLDLSGEPAPGSKSLSQGELEQKFSGAKDVKLLKNMAIAAAAASAEHAKLLGLAGKPADALAKCEPSAELDAFGAVLYKACAIYKESAPGGKLDYKALDAKIRQAVAENSFDFKAAAKIGPSRGI